MDSGSTREIALLVVTEESWVESESPESNVSFFIADKKLIKLYATEFFFGYFQIVGIWNRIGRLVKGLVNLFIPCDRNTDLQWV